jgi:hypothetical protein
VTWIIGLVGIAIAFGITAWLIGRVLKARRQYWAAQDNGSASSPAGAWSVGASLPAAKSLPAANGIRSRIGGVIATLAIMGIGLATTGYGAYTWWVGHSGIPAQVKLVKCHSPGRSKQSDCSATWIQSDGTQRTVTVNDVENDEAFAWPRKTVNVHIRGDQAFMDSSSSYTAVQIIVVGVVFLALSPALGLLNRFRRSRRSRASRTEDPEIPPAHIT